MPLPPFTGAPRWDCHTHIYGPWAQFPLPADAAYIPPAAPFEALLALHQRLGISHGVLVQAAPYGLDHSAILTATAQSDGRYRAIGVIDDSITDQQLEQWHAAGMRGIRFNLMGHLPGARDPHVLRRHAERVNDLGWHVLLHGELAAVLPLLEQWCDLATPLVIDHMARLDFTAALDETLLARFKQQLKQGNRWLKLSGIDRAMQGQPGPWPRALDMTRSLLQHAEERCIWGTDWPHPNIKGPLPDDQQLLTFIEQVCSDPAVANAVLSSNPAWLYR